MQVTPRVQVRWTAAVTPHVSLKFWGHVFLLFSFALALHMDSKGICGFVFFIPQRAVSQDHISYFKIKCSKRDTMKYYSYSRLSPIAISGNAFNYLHLVLPTVTAELLKSIKQGLTMATRNKPFFTQISTLGRLCFFQFQVHSDNSPFSVSETIPHLPQKTLCHETRSALKLCQFTQLRMHLSSGIHPFMMRMQVASLKCQHSPMSFL